jgi:hypothetical protein
MEHFGYNEQALSSDEWLEVVSCFDIDWQKDAGITLRQIKKYRVLGRSRTVIYWLTVVREKDSPEWATSLVQSYLLPS